MAEHDEAEAVLSFWLGELDEDGRAGEAFSARWYKKSAELDAEIESRFGALRREILQDRREHWLEAPRSRLAYIIVLDQFSRNIGRGTLEAFSADDRARDVATGGIARGMDQALDVDERVFFYMPLMHSERLEDQNRCVELFGAFRDTLSGRARARVEANYGYAVRHRDIVARFGRFPHRNEVLGRASTEEERAFLEEPGSGF